MYGVYVAMARRSRGGLARSKQPLLLFKSLARCELRAKKPDVAQGREKTALDYEPAVPAAATDPVRLCCAINITIDSIHRIVYTIYTVYSVFSGTPGTENVSLIAGCPHTVHIHVCLFLEGVLISGMSSC